MPKSKNPDPIASETARRIKEDRKAKGWTQAQLAEATGWKQDDADAGKAKGFSPSRIGNYEQSTRRIAQEEAEVFGRALGRPAAYYLVVLDEHEADVILAIRRRSEPADSRRRTR